MPIYLYWGEDDFAIAQAVKQLQQKILDPNWTQFNYDKISGDQPESMIDGLNQVMTPAFGMGERLVHITETTICQQCSDTLLKELERTLPVIPTNSHLLLTSSKKPDGRLKSSKLLQKHAQVQEFSLIPPWQTDLIVQQVQKFAQQFQLQLKPKAAELLAEAVGNDSRQLWNELEKLSIFISNKTKPIEETDIAHLVVANSQNSLQLATAIRQGKTSLALNLVQNLINHNEPALRICATLVGQFRTWAIIKLLIEEGEKDDQIIAKTADISNPKRIYFLKKEVNHLQAAKLLATLPLLLDLEVTLKRGGDPLATLETKVIELSSQFS